MDLAKGYYPTVEEIVTEAREAINGVEGKYDNYMVEKHSRCHHDQPNPNFTGPF